jgi:AAA domain
MSTDALHFEMFDDAAEDVEKQWLLKGLIALGEDSSWFGPPGSMKSALLLDMAFHITMRRPWRGHEYVYYDEVEAHHEPRAIIYFALERDGLVRARMGAYRARDKPGVPLPVAIVTSSIDLLDPACVDQIANVIYEIERKTRIPVGLLIFDTFSKAIANGDEDKAQTQNLAAANLKRIHEEFNVHIATIGHTGKNANAGERGSNAREGHVDLQVQISGNDNVRTAAVVKANDQAKRTIASFRMEEVTVVRPDREPYTTHIVAAEQPTSAARTAVSKPLTGKAAQALEALRRAIANGRDGAVHADYWKEELTKDGLIKADDKNSRTTFKRIRDALSQQIIEADGFVRIKIPPPPLVCSVAA